MKKAKILNNLPYSRHTNMVEVIFMEKKYVVNNTDTNTQSIKEKNDVEFASEKIFVNEEKNKKTDSTSETNQ